MMSDSDDTDVLLLIPPDLFLVPSSSDSDISSDPAKGNYNNGRTGVISELVEHMQSLETRLTAIESKDDSLDTTLLNNSLDSQIQGGTVTRFRQTLPRTRFSVSQSSSLQNTPVKPRRSLSVPSTPNGYSSSNPTNFHRNDINVGCLFPVAADTNTIRSNDHDKNMHASLMSYSDSSVVPSTSRSTKSPHVVNVSSKREPYSRSIDYNRNIGNVNLQPCEQVHSMPSASTLPSAAGHLHSYNKTTVQEMELSEVEELLQEMEATELELSNKINSTWMQQYLKEQSDISPSKQIDNSIRDEQDVRKHSISRRLEFQPQNSRLQYCDVLPASYQKKCAGMIPDISLPYDDSFHVDETDKVISEFKTWEPRQQQAVLKTEKHKAEYTSILKNTNGLSVRAVPQTNDTKGKESAPEQSTLCMDNVNSVNTTSARNVQTGSSHRNTDTVLPNETKNVEYTAPDPLDVGKSSLQNDNVQQIRETRETPFVKYTTHASTNTDFVLRKSQRLLSLSDFWDNNTNKTQGELLRIKLEEEKFRREHCEHLIQELQKRLLEQQEKVAVALRVDNEKNDLIAQFHNAWSKLKQRVHMLETEHRNLQANFKDMTEKYQSEVAEFQSQIKRCDGELSKALDLAAGYKEKSDGVIKEKVDLLKNHANELESYKSLVEEAENRYEQLKGECNKLMEKNQQTEETLKNLQQELTKEHLKSGEVRSEMNVIHKALDTCETELTILRQEKENLQLKLKEEYNRNTILEQKNTLLLSTIDDAKKAEQLAKDETKTVAEQKEKIRSELQEVYQKQVDEVVKVKLQEFQTQLDAAEAEFLEELKTRQQVIAECAARKIKDVMDKHRLEINLLEEKHKEEKRLYELQLAQTIQKSSILETQLNSQRATKSQLAEKLHSVMQKQWQQALQIISGGNLENLTPLQRNHAEKFFDSKCPRKSESVANCYTKISQEPMRLTVQASETKNFRFGREDQNETASTITALDDTPLTSRKESRDDLRRYVKMIAEMQQSKEELSKVRESISSPPLVCREVPRKHYLKKELGIANREDIPMSQDEAVGSDIFQ